jgi:hypothetical protein
MVPNLVHFIWITGPTSRPFSFINYMAVRAAKEQTGGAVVIHCNEPPSGNKFWDMALRYAAFRRIDVPTHIGGTEITHVQYASDVIRLELLYRWGGIYIDTDMLLIKPVKPLMERKCTMTIESVNNDGTPKSVANGVIFAAPKSEFLKIMLDATPVAMKSDVWANHAVTLPLELAKEYPEMIHLEPQKSFFPFDLSRNWLFEGEKADEYTPMLNETYGVHVYETFWRDSLRYLTPDYVKQGSSLFAKLFSSYT